MSVIDLLTQDVAVVAVTEGAVDDYGNPTETWATVATEKGRFEQRSGEERSTDRATIISDWVLYLNPDTVVTASSRVADSYGRTFEVVGPPAMMSAPNRDVYVEASLRFVEGL